VRRGGGGHERRSPSPRPDDAGRPATARPQRLPQLRRRARGAPYCAQCGQRALPAAPTLGELAREVWDEAVSLDGRFVTSLRLLVTRPGRLTIETHAGRRARYLGPVRLYLLCSVAFLRRGKRAPRALGARAAHRARCSVARRPGGDAGVVPARRAPESRRSARGCARWIAGPTATRAVPGTAAAERPALMFVLLPLYAGLLALLFRGAHVPGARRVRTPPARLHVPCALLARAADLLPTARRTRWWTRRSGSGSSPTRSWRSGECTAGRGSGRSPAACYSAPCTAGCFLLGLIAVVVATALLM
jgi:hypothetical protein